VELGEPAYAKSGDVHIAYRTVGDGPRDLLFMSEWVIPMDAMGEEPHFVRFLRRLQSFGRLILFDRRGIGLSDPISATQPPTLEQWMDDALSVMAEAESREAVLIGGDLGGMVAALLAATHPDRAAALVLINSFPCVRASTQIPWGASDADVELILEAIEGGWGKGYPPVEVLAPSLADDVRFAAWNFNAQRKGASPTTARAVFEIACNSDICSILPSIEIPTLVMHTTGNRMVNVLSGRYIAAQVPSARYVELDGPDHPICVGDADATLDEIEEFLTGTRQAVDVDRVVATVVFTDIVGSTERLVELGDSEWRKLLDRHDTVVRGELARFGGREIKTTGDGFMAAFDGPARATHCARSIVDALRPLGLQIRSGLHTGPCELRGEDLGGLAVHIAARVGSLAESGEVLVSATVKDLVGGSGIRFADRGEHELKGVPGTWRLFAVLS
jgi:class 3 adenylate cyclase